MCQNVQEHCMIRSVSSVEVTMNLLITPMLMVHPLYCLTAIAIANMLPENKSLLLVCHEHWLQPGAWCRIVLWLFTCHAACASCISSIEGLCTKSHQDDCHHPEE